MNAVSVSRSGSVGGLSPRPAVSERRRRSFTWTDAGVLTNWLGQPARGLLDELLNRRARRWLERGWALRLAEFREASNTEQTYFLYGTPAEHPELEWIDQMAVTRKRRRGAPDGARGAPAPSRRKEAMPMT